MGKHYVFISIEKVVKIYQLSQDVVTEIPSAVKYSIVQEEFWTWFEDNIGDLEGHNAFFLADETHPVPPPLQSTEDTYSPRLLQSTLKALFSDTALTVFTGENQSFSLHNQKTETLSLFLLHPLTPLEEDMEEEAEEEVVEVELHLDTGEKSDVKRAFEKMFNELHTN